MFGFFPQCEITDIRAFFLYTKRSIKKALINPGDEHLAEVIELFARGTGSLEEFQLECEGVPDVKFDALVENNQRLHRFEIQFPFESQSSRREIDTTLEITESLLKAPMLKSLYIGDGLSDSAIPELFWSTCARRGIDFCSQK